MIDKYDDIMMPNNFVYEALANIVCDFEQMELALCYQIGFFPCILTQTP